MEQEEDYSKLTTNQKEELLSKSKDLDELILNGLTIKLSEINCVHNENIPLSFYSNFGISINDCLSVMIERDRYEMKPQILEAVLTENIEIINVQKFLVRSLNFSLEDLKKIKEKYNIFDTFNLKPFGEDFDDDQFDIFVDLFIYCLAEDVSLESRGMKGARDIIDYLLDQDESFKWNFSSVLDSAILIGDFQYVEKLLKREVISKGMIYFNKTLPDPKIFDLLSNYLGQDKVYEILLKIFKHYEQYNLKSTIIIMDYMSNIKDADQVIADIKKVQS